MHLVHCVALVCKQLNLKLDNLLSAETIFLVIHRYGHKQGCTVASRMLYMLGALHHFCMVLNWIFFANFDLVLWALRKFLNISVVLDEVSTTVFWSFPSTTLYLQLWLIGRGWQLGWVASLIMFYPYLFIKSSDYLKPDQENSWGLKTLWLLLYSQKFFIFYL